MLHSGQKILESLIWQSKVIGHKIIWLDTGWFLEAVHALYHSAGFNNISPYHGVVVPSRQLGKKMRNDFSSLPRRANILSSG
jgi:hypothetical protein